MVESNPNRDAQLLQHTIEHLQLETGLPASTVREMMEAVAALLLDRAKDQEFSNEGSITVTAGSLRDDLVTLGLSPREVTTRNVEKILESLLAMVR